MVREINKACYICHGDLRIDPDWRPPERAMPPPPEAAAAAAAPVAPPPEAAAAAAAPVAPPPVAAAAADAHVDPRHGMKKKGAAQRMAEAQHAVAQRIEPLFAAEPEVEQYKFGDGNPEILMSAKCGHAIHGKCFEEVCRTQDEPPRLPPLPGPGEVGSTEALRIGDIDWGTERGFARGIDHVMKLTFPYFFRLLNQIVEGDALRKQEELRDLLRDRVHLLRTCRCPGGCTQGDMNPMLERDLLRLEVRAATPEERSEEDQRLGVIVVPAIELLTQPYHYPTNFIAKTVKWIMTILKIVLIVAYFELVACEWLIRAILTTNFQINRDAWNRLWLVQPLREGYREFFR